MVSRRQAYLIVGSCLLAYWYLVFFKFIPYYPFISIPILGSTSSSYLLFSLLTLGAGSALLIYSLIGRSRCKWVIIPLLLLGATIYFTGMRWGPVELLRDMSLMAGLLLSTVYLRRIWIKAIAFVLIFLLIVAMGISLNIQYSLESNPFDVPERDRLNARYGYGFCGEYIVDPTPGLHKIEWSKTLRANDTIACYFKVKLPEASRYVLAGHRFQWGIEKNPPDAEFSFYHSISYCEDLSCLERFPAWKHPFYSYSDGDTGGYGGDLDSARAFNRIDVYVSYRPSDISDRRILSRSYVEVWWRLELNIW